MSVGVIDPSTGQARRGHPARVRVVADRRGRGPRLGARSEGAHADEDRPRDEGGRRADPRDSRRRDPGRARRRRGVGLGRGQPGTRAGRDRDRAGAQRPPPPHPSSRRRRGRSRSCASQSPSPWARAPSGPWSEGGARSPASTRRPARRSAWRKASGHRRRSPPAAARSGSAASSGVTKLDPETGAELGSTFVAKVLDSETTVDRGPRGRRLVHRELEREALAHRFGRRHSPRFVRSRSGPDRGRGRGRRHGLGGEQRRRIGLAHRPGRRLGSEDRARGVARRHRARRSSACGRAPARPSVEPSLLLFQHRQVYGSSDEPQGPRGDRSRPWGGVAAWRRVSLARPAARARPPARRGREACFG